MSKRAKSMFNYQNSGSIIMCHVHMEWFRYLKYPQGSVPFHILPIDIHFINFSFYFSIIAFWNGNKMQPNFNLKYLSSMFLDMARYDTTTTNSDLINKEIIRETLISCESVWIETTELYCLPACDNHNRNKFLFWLHCMKNDFDHKIVVDVF